MKKLLVFLMMLLATLSASARVVSVARDTSGVKLGVRSSFTLSNMNQNVELYSYSMLKGDGIIKSRLASGFSAGFAVDFPVAESFHINVELKYVMKGKKIIGEGDCIYGDYFTLLEHNGYLEMPIQPQFRLNFNPRSHLNFNVGPYLAVALHGNQQIIVPNQLGFGYDDIVKVYMFTTDESKKMDWGNTNELKTPYKRFDVGLSFGVDYVFDKFHFGVSYDMGLTDIYVVELSTLERLFYSPVKNRTLYFTLGWDF